MINKRLIKKCKYDVVIHCMWFCFTLGQIYTLSMRTARKTYHFLGKSFTGCRPHYGTGRAGERAGRPFLRAVARITGRGRASGRARRAGRLFYGLSPALRDGDERGGRGGFFTGCRPHYGTGRGERTSGRGGFFLRAVARITGRGRASGRASGAAFFTGCRPHYGTGTSERTSERMSEGGERGGGDGGRGFRLIASGCC